MRRRNQKGQFVPEREKFEIVHDVVDLLGIIYKMIPLMLCLLVGFFIFWWAFGLKNKFWEAMIELSCGPEIKCCVSKNGAI